jgi:tetratricopeptide (TPR) repeat protein
MFVIAIVTVMTAGVHQSAAQNVNVMNLFGGLMKAAIVEQARAQWRKISTAELACMEDQLQQRGLSSSSLAERGIFPTDGSIASIRTVCIRAALTNSPAPPAVSMAPSAASISPQRLSSSPTFDCTKAKSATARILCIDSAGANADWDITSAYWANLFSLPLSEREAFKRRNDDWPQSLNRICRLRPDQPTYSPQQRQCVLNAFHKQANAYRSRLRGDALAESLMSPEDHAQLQTRFVALGHFYGEPDGEFGPLTREAIKRFQMQSGEPASDFLTRAQRTRLADSPAPSGPVIANPGSSTPLDVGSTTAEAERQCQSNDTDKRLAGCTTIINAQGKGYGVALADAYDGRCRSYNDLGRYHQAAADCRAAIRAKGNHPYAYNNLATALDGLGDTEGAITAYSKSIALKSNFIYSYFGRANIFIRIGDKERAKIDLDKVLSIDPDNSSARDVIASLQIDTPNLKRARVFLEDVQAFVAEQNPVPPSISQIATRAATLQIAISKFDEKETMEAKLRLDGLQIRWRDFKSSSKIARTSAIVERRNI